MQLSAMDDTGRPVDWWFMYKVAGKSTTTDGSKMSGTEYVYFDASMAAGGKLAASPHYVNKDGALPATLNQLYGSAAAANAQLGWFFYNDEDPVTNKVNGSRGHTKGALAFDLQSNTAFWLIQSTPKFPPQGSYGFPATGMPNAQTLLCITLQDADTAKAIANQMYSAQQPQVCVASKVPQGMAADDPRAQLINNQVASGSTPVAASVPFLSKAGLKFTSIAKNKYWGQDFYNDLVGPTLHDNLDVETWEHDPTPEPLDSDRIHTVVDMSGINLAALGYGIEWPESDDHAKLAISDKVEQTHYICVGDINFTIAMRKRSGGTVAFQCEPLWEGISSILEGVSVHLKPGSKAEKQHVARKQAGG